MTRVAKVNYVLQHCEKVITRHQYTGGQSVKLAMIVEDEVKVYSDDPTCGSYVKFDKTPAHVRKTA